jgi:hypothetical protein
MNLLYITVLLAIMQTSPPVPRKATRTIIKTNETPSQNTNGSNQENDNTEHPISISKLPTVTVTTPTRDWAGWGYWAFSLLLVVVGGLQIGLLWRTLGAIRRQADIMDSQKTMLQDSVKAAQDNASAAKEGAEAANKNIEMFISKERARIRVDLLPFSITDMVGETHLINFVITMHGSTAAFITDSGVSAYFLPKDAINVEGVSDAVMFPISNLPSTISPGSPPINTYSFLFIDKDDYALIISEIESGRMVIGMRGFIKYWDVFDKPQETAFRYAWSLEGGPLGALGVINKLSDGEWVRSGPPEDNRET